MSTNDQAFFASQIFWIWSISARYRNNHVLCNQELGFSDLTTAWQLLPDNWLKTTWKLPDDCLTTIQNMTKWWAYKAAPLQIYTVFNCVPLSTIISLYGLHLKSESKKQRQSTVVYLAIVQKVYEWSSCPFAKMILPLGDHFGKRTAWSLIYFLNYG